MRQTQHSVITVVDTNAHRYLLTRKELRELAFENKIEEGNYRSVSKQSIRSLFKRKEGKSQARGKTKGYFYNALTDQKTTSYHFRMSLYSSNHSDWDVIFSVGCKSFSASETHKIRRWATGEPQA